MVKQTPIVWTAFEGDRRIASGDLAHAVNKAKEVVARGERATVLLFEDRTGRQVEVDFREDAGRILARLAEPVEEDRSAAAPKTPRKPGRPKLGVVGREVTLLPRHWAWLNAQPGGASVALRKLVDQARRVNEGRDKVRMAQERAYRFMSAMAGNERNFEEANRALFAADASRFRELTASWPIDVRDHVTMLAAPAFEPEKAA